MAVDKTDAELAGQIRTEMQPHLEAIAAIINRARQAGLLVMYGTPIEMDHTGNANCVVKPGQISRPL